MDQPWTLAASLQPQSLSTDGDRLRRSHGGPFTSAPAHSEGSHPAFHNLVGTYASHAEGRHVDTRLIHDPILLGPWNSARSKKQASVGYVSTYGHADY